MSISQSSRTADALKSCFHISLGVMVALVSICVGLATVSGPVYFRVGDFTMISYDSFDALPRATMEGAYYKDRQYISSSYQEVCMAGESAMEFLSTEPTWQIHTMNVVTEGTVRLVVSKQSDYHRARDSRKEYVDYPSYCALLPIRAGAPLLNLNAETRELTILH